MLKPNPASGAKVIAIILLAFALVSISPRTNAQLRQVVIAPGFEFNVFADTSNVPDFAVSAFAGPTAMAFDSRGRLFVATLHRRGCVGAAHRADAGGRDDHDDRPRRAVS